MTSDDTGSVVSAALAGHELGHRFNIDGNVYSPDRIIQAVGVYERAGG